MQSRQPYIHTYRHKRTYSTPTERHLAFLVQWGRRHQSLFILSCLPFCPSTCLPAYLTVTQMPVCPSAPPLSLSFSLPLLLSLSYSTCLWRLSPTYWFVRLFLPLSPPLSVSASVYLRLSLTHSLSVCLCHDESKSDAIFVRPLHTLSLSLSRCLQFIAYLCLSQSALTCSVSLCQLVSLSFSISVTILAYNRS